MEESEHYERELANLDHEIRHYAAVCGGDLANCGQPAHSPADKARKGQRASTGVQEFLRTTDPADLYLAVQTISEIRRGLENLRQRGDLAQAGKLESWLELLVTDYADRILGLDGECAQLWGCLMAPQQQHPIDKQIAAIALIHDLIVVTRDINDFRGTGVRLKNPFA
jgi:toxin FitB